MNHPTTPRFILANLVAFATALTASAADKHVAPPQKLPEQSLLSFADGKIVFDIQERLRWEIRYNNFDFNRGVNAVTDDDWLVQRFRIGMMLKPVPWLKIYAQAQDSREWLSDRANIPGVLGAEGDDAFDLRQAYIEIANFAKCPWGLKIGRQILSYGDERLIGPTDWNNFGRTFDAVKLTYKAEKWTLDAFVSTVVVPTRAKYNQSDLFNGTETKRGQVFSGAYFSTTALDFQTTEFYALHLHQNGTAGVRDTNFITLGTRMKSAEGKFNGFDYEGEFAVQKGKVAVLDLSAFAAHVAGGYTFDADWKPRLGLEYNYASGDSNPADGNIETFQNLFPTNHKFYGIMDVFAWQNIHDLGASFKVTPIKPVTVGLDFHAFWLADTNDSWYRANGTTTVRTLNRAARGASNYAGSELDLIVTWKACKSFQVQAGFSHFFAGDYLKDTGASSDANFGYVQATLSF